MSTFEDSHHQGLRLSQLPTEFNETELSEPSILTMRTEGNQYLPDVIVSRGQRFPFELRNRSSER